MIASISIIIASKRYSCAVDDRTGKIAIDLLPVTENAVSSFDVEIVFTQAIAFFRNHDYTWRAAGDISASTLSPKILKLKDGCYVQANINSGFWEIRKESPNILLWRFNPDYAMPLTEYTGERNEKKIIMATQKNYFPEMPALLLSYKNAVEFSRSALPFSAIACFTDHCDFDTSENLVMQREFFKTHFVKVTKGFFLNHFSKRIDNASYQNDADELRHWIDDGHELAYHSLSQSIKSDKESFEDFSNFIPPLPNISTWIDHGYQPYNLSLFARCNIQKYDFERTLKDKNISILWNYIDSGTSTIGVINQLNPADFTIQSFLAGNRDFKFSTQISLMIKNVMFHFYGSEQIISAYKNTAASFKKVVYGRNLKSIFSLFKSVFVLASPIMKVFLGWNKNKRTPYKLAKYAPVIFRHTISGAEFYIFQTLEMVDFKRALAPQNIDKLVNENGLFIAHTYFSVPMNYHTGKLFRTPNQIDPDVARNFGYLGSMIKSGKIWNPVLKDLVAFLGNFEQTVSDLDADGNIIVIRAAGLPNRIVI